MKGIVLLSRRTDMPVADFRAYYERHHAPMAVRLLPLRGYARHYVVASDPPDLDIDCLTISDCDRAEVRTLRSFTWMDRVFTEDEARFLRAMPPAGPRIGRFAENSCRGIGIDLVTRYSVGCLDTPLDPGQRRTILFLDRAEASEQRWPDEMARWAGMMVDQKWAAGIAIDEEAPGQEALRFPAPVVVTINPAPAQMLPLPESVSLRANFTVETCTTSPQDIAAAQDARQQERWCPLE
jgi:hypothetical protein